MPNETEIQEEVLVKRGRKAKASMDDDFFPVKLKKNYRPGGEFLIERDGDLVEPGINEDGQDDREKVKAGTVIHIPRSEARRAVDLGIAVRGDEI